MAAALLALAPAAPAETPDLSMPIDCRIGETCMIQQYVDVEPGPDARDYACGQLSYDGHRGTDFRLPSLRAASEGVDVLAAAPGRVVALRDGEPEGVARQSGADAVDPTRACGNAVYIDHGAGWQSRYCHLGLGSVRVRRGQRVERGAVLGRVGLSGNTEFPHLHFQLMRAKTPIDPFSGAAAGAGCDAPKRPLWRAAPGADMGYRPHGLIAAGFADRRVNLGAIQIGQFGRQPFRRDSPVLMFWAEVFGERAGDVASLALLGPDGRVLIERQHSPAAKARATHAWWIGIKPPQGGFAPGRYRGSFRLRSADRGGTVAVARDLVIE